jgi:purine-binding chemotaxis protein CheW
VTRVPRLPDYMLGVINLRGQIISVVDLGKFLGLAGVGASAKSRLVVADADGTKTAFLVDQVLGIEWVEHSRVREPESLQTAVKSEYLRGHVAPVKDEPWVTYLDAAKIISGPDLFMGRK